MMVETIFCHGLVDGKETRLFFEVASIVWYMAARLCEVWGESVERGRSDGRLDARTRREGLSGCLATTYQELGHNSHQSYITNIAIHCPWWSSKTVFSFLHEEQCSTITTLINSCLLMRSSGPGNTTVFHVISGVDWVIMLLVMNWGIWWSGEENRAGAESCGGGTLARDHTPQHSPPRGALPSRSEHCLASDEIIETTTSFLRFDNLVRKIFC